MTLKLETYNTCHTSLHLNTMEEAQEKTRDWYIQFPKRNVYLHVMSGEVFNYDLKCRTKAEVSMEDFISGNVDYARIRKLIGVNKQVISKEINISGETLREIETGRWHKSKHYKFVQWETLFKLYQYYFA